MTTDPSQTDPHKDTPIHRLGPALNSAAGAVIMLHGRGASADDILNLAQAMYHPKLAYLAPAARDHAWYPRPFINPREENEPWLTSASLRALASPPSTPPLIQPATRASSPSPEESSAHSA